MLDVSPATPQAGTPGVALAQPVLAFNASGALTHRYLEAVDRIFAEGGVSSLTSGDTATWDLVDNLGSVRYVLDKTGVVSDRVVYNSFGEITYESSSTVVHFAGFAAGHFDPNTGVVNSYHRWYNPATGRWENLDPEGFAAGDANVSRYLGNNPTDGTDPLGLYPTQGSDYLSKSELLNAPPSPTYIIVWPTAPNGQPAAGPPQVIPVQPTPPIVQPTPPAPGSTMPVPGGKMVYLPPNPPSFPGGWVFIPTGPVIAPPGPKPIPNKPNVYFPYPNDPNKPAPKVGETPMLGPGQPKPVTPPPPPGILIGPPGGPSGGGGPF